MIMNGEKLTNQAFHPCFIYNSYCQACQEQAVLPPVFFMRSSFIVTLIFPFVSFPLLSVVVKITYFAESPYSERFACEAFSSFAFSTSLLISYICFLASLGLKVTILFSVILNFLIFPVSESLNLYSNSSTHSLMRYKSIKQLKTKIQEDIY